MVECVRLRTKWFWVRIQLQSLNLQISRLLRARSSLTFRQLQSVDSLWNAYVTRQEHTVGYQRLIWLYFLRNGSGSVSISKFICITYIPCWYWFEYFLVSDSTVIIAKANGLSLRAPEEHCLPKYFPNIMDLDKIFQIEHMKLCA